MVSLDVSEEVMFFFELAEISLSAMRIVSDAGVLMKSSNATCFRSVVGCLPSVG